MGYVLIDPAGRVRIRQIDHRFGDHAGEMIQGLERIAGVGGEPTVSLAMSGLRFLPMRCVTPKRGWLDETLASERPPSYTLGWDE